MFSLNLLKRTLAFLIESRDEWISSSGISCMSAMNRMTQKMFGNSCGFGFNVSFVDGYVR